MNETNFDPSVARKRIEEAVSILQLLGFPAAQQNERSALSFDFELAVEQDSNRLWLRLSGQEGVKEFVRVEFNIGND